MYSANLLVCIIEPACYLLAYFLKSTRIKQEQTPRNGHKHYTRQATIFKLPHNTKKLHIFLCVIHKTIKNVYTTYIYSTFF